MSLKGPNKNNFYRLTTQEMPLEPIDFPVIFTDLDGTLLDHETYGFGPARAALAYLHAHHIPLILNSSKTMGEILRLRRALDNTHPFIAENGSVVGIPEAYFAGTDLGEQGFEHDRGLWINCLGGNRKEILEILGRIRAEKGFAFTGFSDMTTGQLCRMTGLPEPEARLARKRLSTEPLVWQGTDRQWQIFIADLKKYGLGWVQGGRFISVSRPYDKKDGVKLLMNLYARDRSPVTIGLGDSPNDQAMLNIMDIAVIVKSGRSDQLTVDHPETVIRTTCKGPSGWQEAMDLIFQTGHH